MKKTTIYRFSSAARSITILIFFAIVGGLWLLWATLGPRTSDYFLEIGDRKLGQLVQVNSTSSKGMAPLELDNTNNRALPGEIAPSSAPEPNVQESRSRALSDAGAWGDNFGSLNALFAGLAFTGALAALFMQGQTFEAQQIESHKQRFEETYFELLQLLKSARSEVRYRYTTVYRNARKETNTGDLDQEFRYGSDAFRTAIYEFNYWINAGKTSKPTRKNIERMYSVRVHRRYESTFSPYFRLIYTILKRVSDDKTLTDKEKAQYGNLLRSQLTSFEIGLTAFNGLLMEAKDLDKLITEFRLLKYLPNGSIKDLLKTIYPPEAFEGRGDDGATSTHDNTYLLMIFTGLTSFLAGLTLIWFVGLASGGPTAVVLTLIGACSPNISALNPEKQPVAATQDVTAES